MKRAMAFLAVWLSFAQAQADVPVIDIASQISQAKSLFQELKSYATQLQQYATEARQLEQLTTQVASMIQHPSLGAAMGLMGAAGITNPLPINPYAVMSLTSGLGMQNGLGGLLNNMSNLGNLIDSSSSINHVYTCQDQSFACQQQQQMANANAGYQGVIGKIYTDLTDHVKVTNALRSNLFESTDPAQRENAIAQLIAEQNWVSSASAELNSATALYQAQQIANDNRARESLTQSIDAIDARFAKP